MRMVASRNDIRWQALVKPGPHYQTAILRHPGMTGLLALSGIPYVEFIKRRALFNDELIGGPIPGGILETEIMRKITAPKDARTTSS